MKVPLSWLSEFVAVDLTLDELVETMGRNGLEIEEVRRPGGTVSGVVVARVLEVADHPDADRLVVVRVDDGATERTVCAGARNIVAGDLVAYAVPGARLPDPSGGGTVEIGRRDMRGVTSDGMLCSPRELAVADDHRGILVLDPATASEDAEPGTDIHEVLPLGDPVLDVAVPADRGDLNSVHGVARDLAAILDLEVSDPPGRTDADVDLARGEVPVAISAVDGCSRYIGWVVDDVVHGPAPWWLRRRLEVCGVRSLGNVVDVTNYVMLERGQPLHAFDLDALRGPEIEVRWAEDGEPLRTLDGRDRRLSGDDLVIADADRAVALAGVMGGEETEVTTATTRILLESAAFATAAVRRTSRRLGLVSEASMRFERGVDPEGCVGAAARAVDLLVAHAGSTDAGARADGPGVEVRPSIRLDTGWAARFLGLDGLGAASQRALLERVGVDVGSEETGMLRATPPSWRGDLERPADLAEEIARLHGYDRIPPRLPPITQRGGLTARQRAEAEARAASLAAGFHEAQTTTFVAADALTLLAPDDGRVELENPVAKDAAYLRPGLAEGLLAASRHNVGQGRDGLALGEIGRIFRPHGGTFDRFPIPRWTGPDGSPLPTQPVALGLVAYGVRQGERWVDRDRPWTVFDLLAVADEVTTRVGPPGARLERGETAHPDLHPGRAAALVWEGQTIGVVGQLHPRTAQARDLPESTVVAELLLDPLWAHLRDDVAPLLRARRIARHPALHVDVAVVVDEEVPFAAVEEAVWTGGGELLEQLRWFDEYRGEQVGAGRKSLAFHLRLQAPDRQLTDEDADAVIAQVEAAVERLGGILRR